MLVHADFEACGVLKLTEVGADVWTKHPETQPICLSFAIDNGPVETLVWGKFRHKSGTQALDHLFDAVFRPDTLICAWNAAFEFAMWNNLMATRFGWPELPIERFSCSMAAAACAALPMKLEDAGEALKLSHLKDTAGHALMMRMARPRSLSPLVWWHEVDERKVDLLIAYNQLDVLAERDAHGMIPRMTRREREIWLIDQRMNQRGLPVDDDLRRRLQALTDAEIERIDREITRTTKGEVRSSRQNMKLLTWLQVFGYPYDTLARGAVGDLVSELTPGAAGRPEVKALLLRHEASKTSTAKLKSIEAYAQIDGRARHLTQYGGAARTLRWSGRGPQIQNFPRPVIKGVEQAIDAIKLGLDPDGVRLLFGRPLDVVSSCLRGVFRAPHGFKLVICDFNAIEARVIAWLAGFDELLDVFRRGEDVYVFTARKIGSDDRQLGKVLVLACGFGMGVERFQATALTYGLELTLEEASAGVSGWRRTNRPIVSFWYACERAAKAVIETPGARQRVGKLTFRMADPVLKLKGALLLELPSGRPLVYRNARIEEGRIVYEGVNQYTRKWERLETYGGKLVENATQAVARDLLADCLIELSHESDELLLTTVHDEIVAMAPEKAADTLYRRMRQIMRTVPKWAPGLPLDAQGYISERYRKG